MSHLVSYSQQPIYKLLGYSLGSYSEAKQMQKIPLPYNSLKASKPLKPYKSLLALKHSPFINDDFRAESPGVCSKLQIL